MAKKKTAKTKTTSGSIASSVSAYEKWRKEREQEENDRHKKAIKDLKTVAVELFARGVVKFVCEYNGEGDSGSIEYSYYEKLDAFGPREDSDVPADTKELLENIAWMFIPSGFEINDGGFGTVVFDFETSEISLTNNERVVEINETEETFDFNGDKV